MPNIKNLQTLEINGFLNGFSRVFFKLHECDSPLYTAKKVE